jgi:hypothetical protein
VELIGFIAEDLDLASTYVLRLFVHYLSVFRRSGDVVVGTGNVMDFNLVRIGLNGSNLVDFRLRLQML